MSFLQVSHLHIVLDETPTESHFKTGILFHKDDQKACFEPHHYFHFMECFLVAYAWYMELQANPPPELESVVIPVSILRPFHVDIMNLLLPTARIPQTGSVMIDWAIEPRLDHHGLDDWGNQIPGKNKFIEYSAPVIGAHMPRLRESLAERLRSDREERKSPNARADLRLIYTERKEGPTGRELSRNEKERLASSLRTQLQLDIEFVRFDRLSMEDQWRMVMDCDGLIGVHGNALTHSLWLPPHGMVVEIFPHSFHTYDYQLLAEVGGHHYVGIRNEVPGYVLVARFSPPIIHSHDSIQISQ